MMVKEVLNVVLVFFIVGFVISCNPEKEWSPSTAIEYQGFSKATMNWSRNQIGMYIFT